jgi:nicotinate-nucleotide adenylyltransferase
MMDSLTTMGLSLDKDKVALLGAALLAKYKVIDRSSDVILVANEYNFEKAKEMIKADTEPLGLWCEGKFDFWTVVPWPPEEDDFESICESINETFVAAFGESSISEGKDDLLREATEFSRAATFKDMESELGQVLTSALQRANELKLDPIKLIHNTLKTIKHRSKQYAALGRKVKVAILGGAFDPVTVGHIQNAKHVLDSTDGEIDEVWLMPCFAHLYGKKMASPEHRLEMCRLAAACDKRIRVSDYEIARQFAGDTYYMVKKLLQEDFAQHQYNFSIVIGQDNANTFDRWSNYRHLEQAIRFIVCPRPGIQFDPNQTWYMKTPHIYLKPSNDLVEISSTQVRNAILDGLTGALDAAMNVAFKVDPEVLKYISKHHLYSTV